MHPDSKSAMLFFEGIVSLKNEEWLWQAPFFIAVSVVAGFMGAFFNLLRKWLWRVRVAPSHHRLRLLEAVLVGMLTVGAIFAVSALAGTCVQVRRAALGSNPSQKCAALRCWCVCCYRAEYV